MKRRFQPGDTAWFFKFGVYVTVLEVKEPSGIVVVEGERRGNPLRKNGLGNEATFSIRRWTSEDNLYGPLNKRAAGDSGD